MSFVNTIVDLWGAKRMKRIASYSEHSSDIQHDQFLQLIAKASKTIISAEYDYKSIKNHSTFAERVPVRDYVDYHPYIERMLNGEKNVCWPGKVKWFAKSSGTTDSKSKFIPVTDDALQKCHYMGAKDCVIAYIASHPQSQMLKGKCLTLGGSKEISNVSRGIQTGDLSAILIGNSPFWSDFVKTPIRDIALLAKWEEKLEKITTATINENVTSLAGVPSWFLILLKHVLEVTGKNNLHEVWPNLELFMHGGINFTPYRNQYKQLCPKGINFMETYNASEGFFGIQTEEGEDMRLMLDYGIFYEFVPLSEVGNPYPQARTIDNVELDTDYAVVITTNGGLWRYMIGDTIKFTSLKPHRFIITGRTKHYINAFGEELMIANAEYGLRKACEATNSEIREYTAAPVFMNISTQGCHEWLIEFSKEPNSIQQFADELDKALREVNSDYDAKRYKNITLAAPKITLARNNLFYDWLKSKDKLGGQNKVPRLSNNREYIDSLEKFN